MSRPTAGGTLWKPSNLTQEEGKPRRQASGSTRPLTPSRFLSTCPGEKLRSPRCAFQSRRSRRGLRPSLLVWTVCSEKRGKGERRQRWLSGRMCTPSILLHGFEHGLSIVREGQDQFELSPSCLLDWKIWSNHTHVYTTFTLSPHLDSKPLKEKSICILICQTICDC